MINFSFRHGELLTKSDITDKINKKAISELAEKKIVTSGGDAFFKKYVLSKINAFLDVPIKSIRGQCILGDDFIKFKDFKKQVSRSRMRELKKFEKKDVVRCALRYGLIISNSQQWSLPSAQYDILYNKYGVRYEGFASPFNSKLLGRGKFCSLFEDTDAVFGSIGGFFKTDMATDNVQCWAVNPPYIDKMLINSAAHILKNMSNASKNERSLFVFFIMPGWFDSKAFSMLKKSKYCKRVEILKRGKHFYEHNDSTITAKFSSVVFILDNYSSKKYEGICSGMKY